MQTGVNFYQEFGVSTEAHNASPHRLTQMLMEGVISNIDKAVLAMESDNVPERCRTITKAIDIVMALRAALDKNNGGQVALELDGLYEFMERHLLIANMDDSVEKLQNVKHVMSEIKSGWDQLPDKL